MSLFNRNIILFLSTSSGPPPHTPGPPIPSAQTAFGFPPGALPPTTHNGVLHVGHGFPLPPVPPPGPRMVPPPPGPPPPLLPPPAASSHLAGHSDGGRGEPKPVRDARSDLLSAIRIGESGYRFIWQCCLLVRKKQTWLSETMFCSICGPVRDRCTICDLILIYCMFALRHPAEESSRAAGAAEQAGAGGQRRGHHPVSPYCCGVQWLWRRLWAGGKRVVRLTTWLKICLLDL